MGIKTSRIHIYKNPTIKIHTVTARDLSESSQSCTTVGLDVSCNYISVFGSWPGYEDDPPDVDNADVSQVELYPIGEALHSALHRRHLTFSFQRLSRVVPGLGIVRPAAQI